VAFQDVVIRVHTLAGWLEFADSLVSNANETIVFVITYKSNPSTLEEFWDQRRRNFGETQNAEYFLPTVHKVACFQRWCPFDPRSLADGEVPRLFTRWGMRVQASPNFTHDIVDSIQELFDLVMIESKRHGGTGFFGGQVLLCLKTKA
jgi:hypothetical protein